MAIYKKTLILLWLFLLSVSLYAENKTGKVVSIESFYEGGGMGMSVLKFIYIDNNNDGIIDSIIYIDANNYKYGDGSTENKIALIITGYIKPGSAVVYNFSVAAVELGVFFCDAAAIIYVDGITVIVMLHKYN